MAITINIDQMLKEARAVATGHFVYKALHNHGAGYIDKDKFPLIGASNFSDVLEATAERALLMGLDLSSSKKFGLLLPAYGAIKMGLTAAAYLERRTGTQIIVFETEVERDEKGKRYHIIPDNTKKMIMDIPLLGFEDIVNAGTTLREINDLAWKELMARIKAALSIIDRGGQNTRTLGIDGYYPYMRINMEQHDVREKVCPLCAAGIPIDTELGKGRGWVEMFGQPPYPPDMDFSEFWRKAA
jgi:orotate phosphoribosyltransferase